MDYSFKIYFVITSVMLYLLINLFWKPSKYKPANSEINLSERQKNPLLSLEDKYSQGSLFQCFSNIRSSYNPREDCCQKFLSWYEHSYLSSAVATKSLQMLPVSQVIWETPILQRDPGIYEGGSTAVVVNKERLKHKGTMVSFNKKTANIVMVLQERSRKTTGHCMSEIPWLSTVHGRYLQMTGLAYWKLE